MVAITVSVTGQAPILAKLDRRQAPRLTNTLRRATRAAASAAKPFIQSQAPVRTGATRKSVSVRGSTRGGISARVGPNIWYARFPIAGTSRGVERNPWVERGSEMGRFAEREAFDRTIKADVAR